jgi:hypothetical protein
MRYGRAGAGGKTRPRARSEQAIGRGRASSARHWVARRAGWPGRAARSLPAVSAPRRARTCPPIRPAGRAKMFPRRAARLRRRSRHERTPGAPGKICGPPGEQKREAGCGTGRAAQADNAGSCAAQPRRATHNPLARGPSACSSYSPTVGDLDAAALLRTLAVQEPRRFRPCPRLRSWFLSAADCPRRSNPVRALADSWLRAAADWIRAAASLLITCCLLTSVLVPRAGAHRRDNTVITAKPPAQVLGSAT